MIIALRARIRPFRPRQQILACSHPSMPTGGDLKRASQFERERRQAARDAYFAPYAKPGQKSSAVRSGGGKAHGGGKASHLYTDDNPATTLHGTGFKDAATARHTIELVSQRSLLYQFQTMNTMFHRAKHHPSSASNLNIQAAMEVFEYWLKHTYPAAKHEKPQRKYPLPKTRSVIEVFMPMISQKASELGINLRWTERYLSIEHKGKRLANVLMDNSMPWEQDLAIVRQHGLDGVIDQDFGGLIPKKDDGRLWKDGRVPSDIHLRLLAYAYSPAMAELEKATTNSFGE